MRLPPARPGQRDRMSDPRPPTSWTSGRARALDAPDGVLCQPNQREPRQPRGRPGVDDEVGVLLAEISAPPRRSPLRPAASIRRQA